MSEEQSKLDEGLKIHVKRGSFGFAESGYFVAASQVQPLPRFYMKSAVVTAERLESGRWRVHGARWLEGMEFSEEDFKRNFEAT